MFPGSTYTRGGPSTTHSDPSSNIDLDNCYHPISVDEDDDGRDGNSGHQTNLTENKKQTLLLSNKKQTTLTKNSLTSSTHPSTTILTTTTATTKEAPPLPVVSTTIGRHH